MTKLEFIRKLTKQREYEKKIVKKDYRPRRKEIKEIDMDRIGLLFEDVNQILTDKH
jgi:hypothetical protein